MKIKLLIASDDQDYTEHLSTVLTEKHADAFDVTVCSAPVRLGELLDSQRFDVALLEGPFAAMTGLEAAPIPLLLWDETEAPDMPGAGFRTIAKYQRVSALAGSILEICAAQPLSAGAVGAPKASLTAFWSPAGGVGKTTVALAYAAKKAASGRQVLYLNLEHFSSVPLYFAATGKSISTIFAKLDGNAEMLVRAIRQQDSGTGISYFCPPENFDDMNILPGEDIINLVNACAANADEVVIDLPCLCDGRIRQVLTLADKLFLVTDVTATSQIKLKQFMTQHNVFGRLQAKTALIANKGAMISEPLIETVVSLPLIQAADAATMYKTLADCFAAQV